jgi:hypothetical protein
MKPGRFTDVGRGPDGDAIRVLDDPCRRTVEADGAGCGARVPEVVTRAVTSPAARRHSEMPL